MTRQLEKSLERIKKLTEKQQYEKALLLVDEALSQAPNDLNLMREEMALSLKARDWNDVLRRLKKNMARNRLNELIPDHARGLFLNLVRDTALFRGPWSITS